MASPTQTVVGKGTSNPLIAEDLLKNLRDLSHLSLQNLLPIPFHRIVGPQNQYTFPHKMNSNRIYHVNIIPLTIKNLNTH